MLNLTKKYVDKNKVNVFLKIIFHFQDVSESQKKRRRRTSGGDKTETFEAEGQLAVIITRN